MSMSTMTPDGEQHVPSGWAGQIDSVPDLDSRRPLENRTITEALQRIDHDIDQLQALRASLNGTAGFVTLSNATDITDSTGIALPASEKNASIEGTLGRDIFILNEKLTIKDADISFNTGIGTHSGLIAKTYGNILFLGLNIIPSIAGEDLLVAMIKDVQPALPINVYNVEYDENHKAKYSIRADGQGNTYVYLSTTKTNFYAILSCCILIQ